MLEEKKEFVESIRNDYNIARENCKLYFERMYKILEFSLGVMVAVIGIDSGWLGGNKLEIFEGDVVFLYVLPTCLFVLGLLYTYNAYSLAVYGNEADALRRELYEYHGEYGQNSNASTCRYIKTNSACAIIAYGTCSAFYILAPKFSILFAWHRYFEKTNLRCDNTIFGRLKHVLDMVEDIYYMLPCVLFVVYCIALCVLIVALGKEFGKRMRTDKKSGEMIMKQ